MSNTKIIYKTKTAEEKDIFSHLISCKDNFIPPLDQTVDIKEYVYKIYSKAITFEAWSDDILAGLIAAYFNDSKKHEGFITNVSLINGYMGMGIAKKLIIQCIEYAKKNKFETIALEVNQSNLPAINLYKKFNFVESRNKKESLLMKFEVKNNG